jgi:hypothetical protein
MNYLPSPLTLSDTKMFVSSMILRILDAEVQTSKGRHNFLLQHETREMGVVIVFVTVVMQMKI